MSKELKPVDMAKVEDLTRQLLEAIGEDCNRPGIVDTPKRVARWWREFMEYKPGTTDTTFESMRTDQMVVVSGIRVWSLCEHHLLPFWADVSIGYIAGGRVLGLSKFARIAHKVAHRLQLQEQLVDQIADEVTAATGTGDVAVFATGEHLCMSARGIKTPARMQSSVMRGAFRDDAMARTEFLRFIELAGK